MSDDLKKQHEALSSAAGFVVLEDRCFVRLTGSDRQAFFHNFCTNEIKQLESGQVCEAFVLNSKGKILGFVHAIALDDELLLTGHGDQAPTTLARKRAHRFARNYVCPFAQRCVDLEYEAKQF